MRCSERQIRYEIGKVEIPRFYKYLLSIHWWHAFSFAGITSSYVIFSILVMVHNSMSYFWETTYEDMRHKSKVPKCNFFMFHNSRCPLPLYSARCLPHLPEHRAGTKQVEKMQLDRNAKVHNEASVRNQQKLRYFHVFHVCVHVWAHTGCLCYARLLKGPKIQ